MNEVDFENSFTEKLEEINRALEKSQNEYEEVVALSSLITCLRNSTRMRKYRLSFLSKPQTWKAVFNLLCEKKRFVHHSSLTELYWPISAALDGLITGDEGEEGEEREEIKSLCEMFSNIISETTKRQIYLSWGGMYVLTKSTISIAKRFPCKETTLIALSCLEATKAISFTGSSPKIEVNFAMKMLLPLLSIAYHSSFANDQLILKAKETIHNSFSLPICKDVYDDYRRIAEDRYGNQSRKPEMKQFLMLTEEIASILDDDSSDLDGFIGLGVFLDDIFHTIDKDIVQNLPQNDSKQQQQQQQQQQQSSQSQTTKSNDSNRSVDFRAMKWSFFKSFLEIPLSGLRGQGSKEHKVILLKSAGEIVASTVNANFLGITEMNEEEMQLLETASEAAIAYISSAFNSESFTSATNLAYQLMKIRSQLMEKEVPKIIESLWKTQWETEKSTPPNDFLCCLLDIYAPIRQIDSKFLDFLLTAFKNTSTWGPYFANCIFFKRLSEIVSILPSNQSFGMCERMMKFWNENFASTITTTEFTEENIQSHTRFCALWISVIVGTRFSTTTHKKIDEFTSAFTKSLIEILNSETVSSSVICDLASVLIAVADIPESSQKKEPVLTEDIVFKFFSLIHSKSKSEKSLFKLHLQKAQFELGFAYFKEHSQQLETSVQYLKRAFKHFPKKQYLQNESFNAWTTGIFPGDFPEKSSIISTWQLILANIPVICQFSESSYVELAIKQLFYEFCFGKEMKVLSETVIGSSQFYQLSVMPDLLINVIVSCFKELSEFSDFTTAEWNSIETIIPSANATTTTNSCIDFSEDSILVIKKLLNVLKVLPDCYFKLSQSQELLICLLISCSKLHEKTLLSNCISLIETILRTNCGVIQIPNDVMKYFIERSKETSVSFTFLEQWTTHIICLNLENEEEHNSKKFQPLVQSDLPEEVMQRYCSICLRVVIDDLRQKSLKATSDNKPFIIPEHLFSFCSYCVSLCLKQKEHLTSSAIEVIASILRLSTFISLEQQPKLKELEMQSIPHSKLLAQIANVFGKVGNEEKAELRVSSLSYLQYFIISLRKPIEKTLNPRLLALIHFIAPRTSENEFTMVIRCYEKLLAKIDDNNNICCLSFIRNEMRSQSEKRCLIAVMFFDTLTRRVFSLDNNILGEIFSLISSYTTTVNSNDLPIVLKSIKKINYILVERMESRGKWICQFSLETTDHLLQRDNLDAETFIELVQILQYLIPQSRHYSSVMISVLQSLIRKGCVRAPLSDAILCSQSISRFLVAFTSDTLIRKWSAPICHHVLQTTIAQLEHIEVADAVHIKEALQPGLFALLSSCSEEQLQRVHFITKTRGREIFKDIRNSYNRGNKKYTGKV